MKWLAIGNHWLSIASMPEPAMDDASPPAFSRAWQTWASTLPSSANRSKSTNGARNRCRAWCAEPVHQADAISCVDDGEGEGDGEAERDVEWFASAIGRAVGDEEEPPHPDTTAMLSRTPRHNSFGTLRSV